ncbi:MAG TPA: CBS domain-containing protein [Fodinibius sp.]|nr:CBS domain-containing protein [Fodinibius sp.]
MLIQDQHIVSTFRPLNGTDNIDAVKKRMQTEGFSTLPVVDRTTQTLIGQLGYEDLEAARTGLSVADMDLMEPVKVYRGQHIFEAARLMLQFERKLLPVIDKEWRLLGVLKRSRVLEILPGLLNVAEPGSVITVTLDRIDFSISEIVHLIETENAKILGMTVEKPRQADQSFKISFKLDLQDVSRVAAALRRYDYMVSTNSENEIFTDDIESRADELLKYIDM